MSKPDPSIIPSLLASTPSDSKTSKHPSPSESKSLLFGIPSLSVSTSQVISVSKMLSTPTSLPLFPFG